MRMPAITMEWLKANDACSEARAAHRQKSYTNNAVCILTDLVELETENLYSALDDRTRLQWANWLVARILPHHEQVRYAIFAARQVLALYSTKCPDDDRPLKAIEAAEAYLDGTGAADAAAYAAYAAADAAAGTGAAYAAAYAAEYSATLRRIIENGILLTKGQLRPV